MIHRLFFAQNRMMGAPPGTYEVTFTVKEFFIDPDNAFADTEVGVLQYMTVKIGATEVLTNASGQAVFYLTAGTHTYEVYDNDRYLTTVKGEVTVVASAESVTAKVYPCLYKPTQVANMITPPAWAAGTYDAGWHVDYSGIIYVALLETSEEPGVGTDWEETDSYIPVATDDNLNDLRTTASRTMGQGSICEGTFTTGMDKRYIQVANIDLSSYVSWSPIGVGDSATRFKGIYNGNELNITGLLVSETSISCGLFGTIEDATLENILVSGQVSGPDGLGLLVGAMIESNISNCHGNGSVIGSNWAGGLIGQSILTVGGDVVGCSFTGTVSGAGLVGGFIGRNSSLNSIQNCWVYSGTIQGTANGVGGFVGSNTKQISNCHTLNVSVESSSINIGGFCGYSSEASGVIQQCYSNGSVNATSTATRLVGGFIGQNFSGGSVINCYSSSSVVSNKDDRIGGFVGANLATMTNCYATGSVTSPTYVLTGGFAGSGGTLTNCYYDSQTSGLSDTGKGLPRTTAQMKYGTASSFINTDGTTDATEDPANAMYTSWDTDIWDFLTTSDYPVLK